MFLSGNGQGNDFTTAVGRGTLCLDVYPSPRRIALKCIATCKGGCGSSKPPGIYRTPCQPCFHHLPSPHSCLQPSTLSRSMQECNVTTDVLSLPSRHSSSLRTRFERIDSSMYSSHRYVRLVFVTRCHGEQGFSKIAQSIRIWIRGCVIGGDGRDQCRSFRRQISVSALVTLC